MYDNTNESYLNLYYYVKLDPLSNCIFQIQDSTIVVPRSSNDEMPTSTSSMTSKVTHVASV